MSEMPKWMGPLVEAVASGMTAHGDAGPLGLRYRRLDDVWDVLIYRLPAEVVGGANDGEVVAPGFAMDLATLRDAFGRVDGLGWDALGTGPDGSETGPCVWVEGEFAGREVLLRVLASAPPDEEPASKVDATGRAA